MLPWHSRRTSLLKGGAGGGGGGGGSLPPDVLPFTTGLAGWWKANALFDTNANADPVSLWTDSSGLGRDATQATAARRPIYRTNVVNGYPVVRFDGVDDHLQTALFGVDIPQPTTMFAVWTNRDTTRATIVLYSGIANLKRQQQSLNAVSNIHGIFAGASLSGGTMNAVGVFSLTTLIFNGLGTQLWDNGVSEIGPGNGGSQVIDGLTIGNVDPSVGSWPFNGDIAELVFYTGALVAGDRALVESYLRGKYAIV